MAFFENYAFNANIIICYVYTPTCLGGVAVRASVRDANLPGSNPGTSLIFLPFSIFSNFEVKNIKIFISLGESHSWKVTHHTIG